jgi:hypothetical protein
MGVTGGTPAGINLFLGYWWGKPENYITRLSAMHFGSSLFGIQFDFGKSFYQAQDFRAFYSVSLRHSHMTSGATDVDFTGVGPLVGFNWKYLFMELGFSLGPGTNTKIFPFMKSETVSSGMTFQIQYQVGFSAMFLQ